MNELSHSAPLYCPKCGEIVEVEGEEGSWIYYWCWECEEAIDPVSELPPETAD